MRNWVAFVSASVVGIIICSHSSDAQQVPSIPNLSFPEGSGAVRAMMLEPKLDGVIGKYEWTQFYGIPIAGGPSFLGTPLSPFNNQGTPSSPSNGALSPLVPAGAIGTPATRISGLTILHQTAINPATSGGAVTGASTAGVSTSGLLPSIVKKVSKAVGTGTGSKIGDGSTGSSANANNPIEGRIGPAQNLSGGGQGSQSTQPTTSGAMGTTGTSEATAGAVGQGSQSTQPTTGTQATAGAVGATTGNSEMATAGAVGSGIDQQSSQTSTIQIAPAIPIQAIPSDVQKMTLGTTLPVQTPTMENLSNIPTRSTSAGFLNWIPGKLGVAAVIAKGDDLLISIDGKGDGRPFGSDADDIEVRISLANHTVTVRHDSNFQFSDAVGWKGLVKYVSAPSTDPNLAGSELIEATITDPSGEILPQKQDDFVALRVDGILPTQQTTPNQQRALTLIRCESSIGPNGSATSKVGSAPIVSISGPRGAVPGESSGLTFNVTRLGDGFSNGGTFKIEGVGVDQGAIASLSAALPPKDKFGIVHIPYQTLTSQGATFGHGALHLNLTGSDGIGYDYLLPYAITDWVTLSSKSTTIYGVNKPMVLNMRANIVSNDRSRLQGIFEVDVPSGWKVTRGNRMGFVIYNQTGVSKRSFSILVPAGTKGSFRIELKCVFPTKTISKFVTVSIL